jgi:hypothetical protein
MIGNVNKSGIKINQAINAIKYRVNAFSLQWGQNFKRK